MPSEKGLNEQRNDLLEEMETLINKVRAENRAFVDEELTRIETLRTEVRNIDNTLKVMEETRQLEKTTVKKPVEVRTSEQEELEHDKRTFMSIIRGEKVEARADLLNTSNQGVIIPKTISTQIIEVVKNLSPIFSMATMYNVGGDLLLPTYDYTSHLPAYYVDDFSVIPSVSTNFGQVNLTNRIIATRTLISKSLINRTDIDVVPMITRMIGQAFAHFLEKELVAGAGGTTKLNGLAQIDVANQTLTSSAAAVISPQLLLNLMMKVPQVYQSGASWIMHPQTLSYLQGLTAGAGNNTLIMGNTMAEGSPFTLFGKPVYVSDNMPLMGAGNKEVFYGDYSGLVVKMTSNIGIQVLMEKYADVYAIGVIGTAEMDSIIADKVKIVGVIGGA